MIASHYIGMKFLIPVMELRTGEKRREEGKERRVFCLCLRVCSGSEVL
jgi:hypothetical protein